MNARRPVLRTWSWMFAAALALACALWTGVAVAEPFREPAGPMQLGTRSYTVTAAQGAEQRHIGIRLFYPAGRAPRRAERGRYAEAALVAAMQEANYFDVPDDVLETWGELALSARPNVPVSTEQNWPLVLFAPGYGMSSVNYTVFAQDLASRGLIVAVIDSPGAGFMLAPDGALVAAGAPDEALAPQRTLQLAGDARMVASWLLMQSAFNIDPERIAMMGHSLGGAAALEACRLDTRIRACVDLDGHPFGPVRQLGFDAPALVFLSKPSSRGAALEAPGLERAAMWREVGERREACAYVVTVSETSHLSFTDFYAATPEPVYAQLGALRANDLYGAVNEIAYAFLTEAFAGAFAGATPTQAERRDFISLEAYGACAAPN